MSSDISSSGAASHKREGGVMRFLENAMTLFVVFLIGAGLVAITATWRSNTIEFVGGDRLRLTQNEWWGLVINESLYRSTGSGWVVIRANGDEVPVALQPIKIND